MNKKRVSKWRKFKRYMKRTWKNKVCAVVLTLIALGASLLTKDASPIFAFSIFTLPVFFTNEDVFDRFG